MAKVYMTKLVNGEEVETLNEKVTNMTDILFEECKKAYAQAGIVLLKVRMIVTDFRKNPAYESYNNFMNEGGEGYNPYDEFLSNGQKELIWKV